MSYAALTSIEAQDWLALLEFLRQHDENAVVWRRDDGGLVIGGIEGDANNKYTEIGTVGGYLEFLSY